MTYIYFDMNKTAILQDKIYKLVLDGDEFINIYYETELMTIGDIIPSAKEFFKEDEEVEEDIINDWFIKFCGCMAETFEGEDIVSVHYIVENACSDLCREMTDWRKRNPNLYKKKSCCENPNG